MTTDSPLAKPTPITGHAQTRVPPASTAYGIAVAMALGALATSPTACVTTDPNEGWVVVCREEVSPGHWEPYPDFGYVAASICVAKNIEGGTGHANLQKACAQAIGDFFPPPEDPDLLIGEIKKVDGTKQECQLDDWPDNELYPIDSLDDGDDEAGSSGPGNEVKCCYDVIYEKDGASHQGVACDREPNLGCYDPQTSNVADYCIAKACDETFAPWWSDQFYWTWVENDPLAFVQILGCSANLEESVETAVNACVPTEPDPIPLGAYAELTFGSGLGAITEPFTGIIKVDDSMCVSGAGCNPTLSLWLELDEAGGTFLDPAGGLHTYELHGLVLEQDRPAAVEQDLSGARVIPEAEFRAYVDAALIDGVPLDVAPIGRYLERIAVTMSPAIRGTECHLGLSAALQLEEGPFTLDVWASDARICSWIAP